MAQQIQLRRDTAANWTATNPTLAQGELGLETDTNSFKFGDGSTAWTSLGYVISGNYQPLDGDLTAIAALSPSNDDIIQRKAGAWTNRSVAQYLTDLGIAATYETIANVALKQNLVISETTITDGASIDLTGQNNVLASSQATINVAVTNTSTFIRLRIVLAGTSLVLTFTDSTSTRCVNSDSTKSGDNTCTLSGTTGSRYEVMLAALGSGVYDVIAQNMSE